MKISYKWLAEYSGLQLPVDVISEMLTQCGLEVEGIETFESVKGGLKGIVIGQVLSTQKHPDADKLTLTLVNTGEDKPRPIVCGAPNVATGQKVLVALPGTQLYFGDKTVEIKSAKIRGQISEGMICAEDEIGLGNSHDGIMILPDSAQVGMPAAEYFQVESDIVFEIGLTPNRTDAISHIGVARDLIACWNQRNPNERKTLLIPDVENFTISSNDNFIEIQIENPADCPRYTGLTISGITVEPSPAWLQNRLLAIGLKPINNIVDITNYVLFETGQPLHTFDLSAIEGKKVIVKKLPPGTSFITLDGVERKLTGDDLMICNAKTGMCMAGVYGGLHSGVSSYTNSVFLESACFDPKTIRKTSKHHNLKTDASFRFERGTDIGITVYAIKRAAQLICQIAGGTISSEINDVYPLKREKASISLKTEHVDALIGKKIPQSSMISILKDLDFEVISTDAERIEVLAPFAKVDVKREADVVEEILRIYGYNNVEIQDSFHSFLNYSEYPSYDFLLEHIANILSSNGFNEVMNNSLTASSYYQYLNEEEQRTLVRLLNPLSKELNVMRKTLIFGGLENIRFNINRKQHNIRLFETGAVYECNLQSKSQMVDEKYKEHQKLALFITGNENPENWKFKEQKTDIFSLKFWVHKILQNMGVDLENIESQTFSDPIFYEGIQYRLQGKEIVKMGQIHNTQLEKFDIYQAVFAAELSIDVLIECRKSQKYQYSEYSHFPEVKRDLALLLDQHILYSELKEAAYKAEPELLKKVNLFDVYEGDKIGVGKKSYAMSFYLQSPVKTLTDKEIDKCMDKIIKAFQQKFGATIR